MLHRRVAAIGLVGSVVFALAGCNSAPAAPATSGGSGGSPLTVNGDNGGVSARFTLSGGSYHVEWSMTADQAGCTFLLFLATVRDGPTVKDTGAAIMPDAQSYSGSADWTGVPAGSYVLQEDQSGLLNCTGSWNATITPQ